MPVHNSDIAAAFREIADLLELQDANEFRVRAYRDAARTIDGLSGKLTDMVEDGEDLTELDNIGESTAEKIEEYIETGAIEQLDELRSEIPTGLREVMQVEGLGPKRTRELYDELGIENLDDLEQAAEDGEIADISGFGEKTEENIEEGVDRARETTSRTPLPTAEELSEPLVRLLGDIDGVDRVSVAGSFRRRKETVGDLDILVTCDDSERVMDAFVDYEDVVDVVSRGDTRSTVVLENDFHVDLRVVKDASYGAAMHYFTGSKEHNVACRQLGVERDLKINEYGIFDQDDERIGGEKEQDIYDVLEMDYVAPELREDRGELDAAREGALPELIELDDIRGDLHCHTGATDGRHSLRDMVEAAVEMGHDYLAITDHSKSMTVAAGLDADDLRKQFEAIDEVNDAFEGIEVLKGCEVDILEDGSLDLDDDILDELDIVVCSVHSKMNLGGDEQTERIIRAIEHPLCHIIGHPSGRLIGQREAYDVDIEAIIEAAAENDVALELNAQPERLDLDDRYCKQAKEAGVRIVISTDAHAQSDFRNIKYGVYQARRGWLEAGDVLNTMSTSDLLEWLE
ncbi:MAG: DNA polymerase/3'-5' exonuclease PolX [Myxococcota bacterium]